MENQLPNWIAYHNDELYLDKFKARDLVEEFETPLMVYSQNRLKQNAISIQNAFSNCDPRSMIYYAYKACYYKEVTNTFAENNIGAEVMSPMEYQLAINSGFVGNKIIVNGLGKTEPEITQALQNDVFLINVDSMDDLILVNKIASKIHKKVNIGVRVYPSITDSHFSRTPGKLGLHIKSGDAKRVILAAKKMPFVSLVALHVHTYSLQTNPTLHQKVAESVAEFASQLAQQEDIYFKYIDIGGGLNSRYLIERSGWNIKDFAKNLVPIVSSIAGNPTAIVEPGTFLVNDAAVVLTKVICEKINNGKRWLVVDAGVNVLNPSPFAYYEIHPALREEHDNDHFGIVDGLCSPVSIQKKAILPRTITKGSILAILNCGGYTLSSARSWGYPLFPVVFTTKDKAKLLVTKERVLKLQNMMHGII
ncbi:hypothetical protein [Candidatus Uabimicrobium sp. HlEnr_7]|uniref:diaminopimelate decarboxylase family protein n=1 Tax=Candidatus Uabimicrobium helgolandensis TaxID=3095367 RepID=UPI0035561996